MLTKMNSKGHDFLQTHPIRKGAKVVLNFLIRQLLLVLASVALLCCVCGILAAGFSRSQLVSVKESANVIICVNWETNEPRKFVSFVVQRKSSTLGPVRVLNIIVMYEVWF